MRRHNSPAALPLLAGLLLIAGPVFAQSGGPYDLSWSTIDGGGFTFSTGGSYSLGATAGQPDAGSLGGSTFALNGGFWGAFAFAPCGSPPTAVVSGDATICLGQSALIQAGLTGNPPWTLTWSDAFQQVAQTSPATRQVAPSSTTIYTVSALADATCASGTSSGSATVTVNPPPTASASGGGTICAGGSIAISGSGGASCVWVPATGLTDPNSCNPMASPSQTTSYTLFVTDANGCVSANNPQATVTVVPVPAPVITVSHCLTPNTSGQTASVPANAGDTYTWTITGGTIDSGQGTDTISFTSGGPATLMTLNVTETTVDGCTGNAADTMQVNFNDVAASNPFYTFICTIARHAITAGCGGGNFCPANLELRSQMAVFLLRGEHGSVYVPPPAVGIFGDVPASNPFAPWIEELYNESITGGCSTNPLLYCPNNAVSRAGMAVFLLVAEHGTGYVPPACAGIFMDVACPSPFANWIEELDIEGITAGCSTNPPAYCPGDPVTRAQMAVFLTTTFALQ